MSDEYVPTHYSDRLKNAEAHCRLLSSSARRREERFQTLVHAGICDTWGNLPPYRDGDEMP